LGLTWLWLSLCWWCSYWLLSSTLNSIFSPLLASIIDTISV
jgi:hypothetical protein